MSVGVQCAPLAARWRSYRPGMASTKSNRADTKPPAWLKEGVRATDTATDRTGVVMSVGLIHGGVQLAPPDRVWLRPPGGGREWEAPADRLAPAAQ